MIEQCPFLILADIKKQGPVELDRGKRKLHDRIEIGVAGTEIIQAETDPRGCKFIHNHSQTCIIFRCHSFCDLKLYPFMRDFIFVHDADEMAAAVRSHQIQRREIHFHVQKPFHQFSMLF